MELAITNAIREFEEKHQGVKVDSISVITIQGTFGPGSTIKSVSLDLKIGE